MKYILYKCNHTITMNDPIEHTDLEAGCKYLL